MEPTICKKPVRLATLVFIFCVLSMLNQQVRVSFNMNDQVVADYGSGEEKLGFSATSSSPAIVTLERGRHIVLDVRAGLRTVESIEKNSIPVVLWPLMDSARIGKAAGKAGTSPDVTHIEEDGVLRSSVLSLANDSIRTLHQNVVWVTDAKFPSKVWCTRLHKKVLTTKERRRERGLSTEWPIFVVDFSDKPKYQACEALETALGPSWIFYSKRSTVTNRSWNFETDWLDLGHELPETTVEGRFYERTHLVVRSDIVEAVEQEVRKRLRVSNESLPVPGESFGGGTENDTWERKIDVAHYWPASKDPADFSNLRNRVSVTLLEKLSSKYNVFCDMIGMADRVGRRHVQTEYVKAMLDTKIVVVAQRDLYEDHYRLYEALVSGALVMTDPMLRLPAGLKNGTSIVIYDSLNDLVRLAEYFLNHKEERLKIADEGGRVAMSRHRSWHRMEEVILGRLVTQ